jgi:hypothetical protein
MTLFHVIRIEDDREMDTYQIVKALTQGMIQDPTTTTASHTLSDTRSRRASLGGEDLSDFSEGKIDLLDFAETSDIGERFSSSVQGGSEIDEPFKVTEK